MNVQRAIKIVECCLHEPKLVVNLSIATERLPVFMDTRMFLMVENNSPLLRKRQNLRN